MLMCYVGEKKKTQIQNNQNELCCTQKQFQSL